MNMQTITISAWIFRGLLISTLMMCFTNLIEINTSWANSYVSASAKKSLKDKSNNVTYDPGVLKTIGERANHNARYRVMPFGSIRKI